MAEKRRAGFHFFSPFFLSDPVSDAPRNYPPCHPSTHTTTPTTTSPSNWLSPPDDTRDTMAWLIFTDMQSVRLPFRRRASGIKCPGEKPFIRNSLSAAPHAEPHPSPFAEYLRPISPAKSGSVSPQSRCCGAKKKKRSGDSERPAYDSPASCIYYLFISLFIDVRN